MKAQKSSNSTGLETVRNDFGKWNLAPALKDGEVEQEVIMESKGRHENRLKRAHRATWRKTTSHGHWSL